MNFKSCVLTLVMLIASPAWAVWEEVATGASGSVAYIDPATIKKDGALRRVWGLSDIANPTSGGVLSRKLLREIDCKNEKARILTLVSYSKAMGDGVVLGSDNDVGQWDYIVPDSVLALIYKRVCFN